MAPDERPLVVLSCKSRLGGAQFAQTTASARTLSTFSDIGFQVIIDSSDNSFPTEAYSSKRELTLEIGLMLPENIESAFPELVKSLKSVNGALEVCIYVCLLCCLCVFLYVYLCVCLEICMFDARCMYGWMVDAVYL